MKRTYEIELKKEGIADTRTEEIFEAMDKMHAALSKLDLGARRIFWSKNFHDRINEFADIEQLSLL
jgi:hypothetical protein